MPGHQRRPSSTAYEKIFENGDVPSTSSALSVGPLARHTGEKTIHVVDESPASNGLKHSLIDSSRGPFSFAQKPELSQRRNPSDGLMACNGNPPGRTLRDDGDPPVRTLRDGSCDGDLNYPLSSTVEFRPHPDDEIKEAGKMPSSDESIQEVPPPPGEGTKPWSCKWRHWAVLCSLAYGNFAVGACYSLQTPFFPKEATNKGATSSQYGLVLGIYQLTMFIFSPIFGKIISYTNPKTLLGGGMFVVGTAAILFGLIDRAPNLTWFLTLAFAIRIMEGIGSASLSTGMYSYIAMSYASTMATTFTTLEMFFGLGLILGPTLGGLLYDAGGYQLPFLVVGSVTVLDAILKYFILDPSGSREQSGGNLLKFYLNLGVWLYFLIIFTTFGFIGFNTAALEPHLQPFNLTGIAMGGMCAIQGAVYSLMSPLWGKFCDLGVTPMVLGLIGSIMTAVSLTVLGPLDFIPLKKNLALIGVSLGISGLGIGGKIVCTYIGLLIDTKARGFPDDVSTYGLASSTIAAAMSLGAFAGPSIGGYLLDAVGFSMATFYLFICELIVTLLIVVELFHRWFKWRQRADPERLSLLTQNHPNYTVNA